MLDSQDLATAVIVSREKTKQGPVANGTDLLKMVVQFGGYFRTPSGLYYFWLL